MLSETQKLWLEMVLLFIVTPIIFASPFLVWIKIIAGLLALIYLIWIVTSMGWLVKPKWDMPKSPHFWKRPSLLFAIFLLLSTGVVYSLFPNKLFSIVLEKPLLWMGILAVYSFLSVYPQELIYRGFFRKRYGSLIGTELRLILMNATLFSLAHLFLWNPYVLILTFAGGMLFMSTYLRSNSLVFTSIEHAAYGLWIFTLGVGQMLAFPI